MGQIDDVLTRGVENIIPGKEQLEKALRSGNILNVYYGIDPTATHIHIGNAVALRRLQSFVNLGHNVTFLIGDFTALIGDTSDKESERPVLTTEQIKENFKNYKSQAEKLVDFSKITLKHNSEWLSKLTFEDIVKLTQHFSAGDFTSRELIRKRLDEGKKVGLHELLYPVMQGYDSYILDTDIQLGGADQTFNMQAGRILQKDLRNKESAVLVTGYLEGTDGRKMSKSWGNAIWLDDEPNDMFGKVMSVKDDLIIQYFTLATNLPLAEIAEIKKELESGKNPMVAKKTLAHQIIKELHSEELAESAEQHFEQTFQKGNLDSVEMPETETPKESLDPESLVAKYGNLSKTEAKRLIDQNAVELSGKTLNREEVTIKPGDILKIGKRKFLKFV